MKEIKKWLFPLTLGNNQMRIKKGVKLYVLVYPFIIAVKLQEN